MTSIPLQNKGSRPAVLIEIHPQKDVRGLTFRYAASSGSGMHIGAARGWKPRVWALRPFGGYELPSGERAGVMIGVKADRRGIYVIPSFVLTYRIGHTRYRATYRDGLTACVGMKTCQRLRLR